MTDIENDVENSKSKIDWKSLVTTVKTRVGDTKRKLHGKELQKLGLTVTKEVCVVVLLPFLLFYYHFHCIVYYCCYSYYLLYRNECVVYNA